MEVARRTVAKYRDMLNIPSSSQRRREARLQNLVSGWKLSILIIQDSNLFRGIEFGIKNKS